MLRSAIRPEAFYRIGQRGANRLKTDRSQGYKQGKGSGESEDPPFNIDAIRKILQPPVHDKPGYRGCYHERHQHQADKVAGQQQHDIPHRGTQYFADADLFCPLRRGEEGETQQSEAGDEDGETGEYAECFAEKLVVGVLFVVVLIQEIIIEKVAGEETVIGLFEGGDGGG